jgi:hypothetical protein
MGNPNSPSSTRRHPIPFVRARTPSAADGIHIHGLAGEVFQVTGKQLLQILPLAAIHTLGNTLTNISLGAVAVSFTHTIKVSSRKKV